MSGRSSSEPLVSGSFVSLSALSHAERPLHSCSDDDGEPRESAAMRRWWPAVRRLIDERLSDRQRQVIELACLRGLDQPTVADLLGISQQAVSEHLHGKRRGGCTVGGALRKLRKLCEAEGIGPWSREVSHPASCVRSPIRTGCNL